MSLKPSISNPIPIVLSLLPLFLIAFFSTKYFVEKTATERLKLNSEQQLVQFVGNLNAQLNRFKDIPQVIAKTQQVIDFIRLPKTKESALQVNQYLEEVNEAIGASDTYLIDHKGLTIAASNWRHEKTFIGEDLSFRPYFSDAVKGQLGQYFALGTTSGTRGYYYSYPIYVNANIKGVIVVKINLSTVEQRWSERETKFIVTDQYGVILMTTEPHWLYKSLKPLTSLIRTQLMNSQQYGKKRIELIDYQFDKNLFDGYKTLYFGENRDVRFLQIQDDMPQTGWTVIAFTSLQSVEKDKRNAIFILILIAVVFLLIAYLANQKKKRREEKASDLLRAQKNLKHEVQIRTADLSREVQQHKQTEALLKETQKELIQTAKLAVLGEMSASISHELNNPLAAIRSYTDNARKLLELNKTQMVDDNLNRISSLTDRMGKISSQLKLFTRKSEDVIGETHLKQVILSAIEISYPQFKLFNIPIHIENVRSDLDVKANSVQLEQVLVNILTNALFAIGSADDGCVTISSKEVGANVEISIEDNGPGINLKNPKQVFDPFYTTKKLGMGLGLSISARIIEGFDGWISVENNQPHGARFMITLKKYRKEDE